MSPLTCLWPLAAILAAVGLHSIAPRRAPLLYLGPATGTAVFICLCAALAAAVIH
ncbi:hypothetical protein ACFUIY_14735 [Streptomyces griseorubiginosus]|uniref:hypothetical protein n=1 Tax=Streptomyces griseorubiginosus TaxID=67304 RepID=UPI00362A199C